MIKRYLSVFFLLFMLSVSGNAQKLLWNVGFDTKFDNHEFLKMPVGESKTLFGLFLAPTIGFGWGEDDAHSLMIGGDIFRSFGDYVTPYTCDLQIYYHLNKEHFNVYAGAFPTLDSFDEYSTAFISDEKRFSDVVLEGVKFGYKNDKGYVNVIFDWALRNSSFTSEILSLFSSSRFSFDWFYLGYLCNVNHYAIDIMAENVVDNIWVNPFVGFSFSRMTPFEVLDFRLGWIHTFQRDRWVSMDMTTPYGGQFDVTLQKWGVGIKNTVYVGQNLMPYYNRTNSYGDIYGSGLYYGDVMYSIDSGFYDRLEAYWNAYSNNFLDVKVSAVMHSDRFGNLGWQQKASLNVNLDNVSWKKMIDRRKAAKAVKNEKD